MDEKISILIMKKFQVGFRLWVFLFFSFLFFSNSILYAQQVDSILSYIESVKGEKARLESIYQNTGKIATVEPAKLLLLYNLLKQINKDGENLMATAQGYAIMGQYHSIAGNSDSVMHYKLRAITAFRNLPATAQKVSAFNSISSNYYYQGELDKYLAYNDTAYQITQELKERNTQLELMILFNRTPVLFEIHKIEEAYIILKKIERDLIKTNLDGFKGKLALRLYYYFKSVKFDGDSSLYYAKKSLGYAKVTSSNSYMASSYSAIGASYSSIKEFGLATIYLDSALYVNGNLNDNEAHVGIQFDRLVNYKYLGDFERAEDIWMKTMELVEREGLNHWRLRLLNERVLFFEAKGDFKSALAANKTFETFSDSVKSTELKEKLAEMEVRHQTYEKDLKLARYSREKEMADAELKYIYILGFAVVSILTVVLFFTKRNSKLNQTLIKEKQKTLELELERKRLEETRLKEENERQKNQLSTKALEVGQRNGILLDVYKQIRLLQEKDIEEQRELIGNLDSQIGSYMRSGEDWKRIRVQLDKVSSTLTDKIKNTYPQLTSKDLRMLMLFKLGLNIKEVANLLSLAPSSVKMSRYRLKKKLNLEEADDLEGFLKSFEEENPY